MTSAFAEDVDSLTREIWLDRKDHLHVRDIIRTGDRKADVMWVMTTTADAHINPDGSILLEKDGKKMKLKAAGKGMEPHVWPNDPPRDYDAPNPGTCRSGFIMTVPAASEVVMEVSLVPVK
jgi:hypothetical protein